VHPPLLNLEYGFRKLATAGYNKTSDQTGCFPQPGAYNCIAWAAQDIHHWWWPSLYEYWPSWIRPREATVLCFINTFRWFGYRVCDNSRRERGFQKVALYAIHVSHTPRPLPSTLEELNDFWEPTHMARQLRNGKWSSKCGPNEDITHYTLDALESYGPRYGSNDEYGCDILYMRRFFVIGWFVRSLQYAHWVAGSLARVIVGLLH
jgi:hypothetical protein